MKLRINLCIPGLPEPSESVARLMDAVVAAHQISARSNTNISTVTARNAAIGSGRLANAIAAAILTIGAAHAPLGEARLLLETAEAADVRHFAEAGHKIAGFGNSFYPDGDPAWSPVADILRSDFPAMHLRIEELAAAVKKARPNAALYTAAACVLAKVPHGIEELVFVLARTPVWANEFIRTKGEW